ncbi:opine metallophore biosynthesis dehydrogenase [Staphylococcus aureus]
MDEGDIEHFGNLARYLTRISALCKYTAILIDPFSQPDKNGHYLIFSAIRI